MFRYLQVIHLATAGEHCGILWRPIGVEMGIARDVPPDDVLSKSGCCLVDRLPFLDCLRKDGNIKKEDVQI